MTARGIILYEDSMQPSAGGSFPLHDVVLRMVEDEIGGETWRLHKSIDKNPRNGVDKLIADVANTSLIAQAGRLYVLVDLDRVGEHLRLGARASEAAIHDELQRRSDAPDKLHVYFLQPNLEGLLRAIGRCAPALEPAQLAKALQKKVMARDLVLNQVKRAEHGDLRRCMRGHQPGVDALVRSLAGYLA